VLPNQNSIFNDAVRGVIMTDNTAETDFQSVMRSKKNLNGGWKTYIRMMKPGRLIPRKYAYLMREYPNSKGHWQKVPKDFWPA